MREFRDGYHVAQGFDLSIRHQDFSLRAPFFEVAGHHRYSNSFGPHNFLPTIQITDHHFNSRCMPHSRSVFHDRYFMEDRPWLRMRDGSNFGTPDMTYHRMRGCARPEYPVPQIHPSCRLMQPVPDVPPYYAPHNNTMRRIAYQPEQQRMQPQQAVFQPDQQSMRPQPAVFQPQRNFQPEYRQPAPQSDRQTPRSPEQPIRTNPNGSSSILDSRDFVDRVIANISSHEGNFTSINPNDVGYGISIGIRQWNQKAGELPVLFKAWNRQDPQKFQQIFGPYAQQLLNDKWVRSYDMIHDDQFMSRLKTALADKEYQQVQVSESRAFVKRNIELANSYGFKSELGVALVCDMVNHMGKGGTEKAMQKIGLVKGGHIADERRASERLSSVRPNGQKFYAMLDKKFSPTTYANPANPNSNPNVAYA